MSQYFASDSAFDVNQVNWNWIFSFVDGEGKSKFYDINQVADIIDLSQFDAGALEQAVRAWRQLADGGLSTQRLLVVDCGLTPDGRALAERLCAQDARLALCTAEKLGIIVRLGIYNGGTADGDDLRHGAERDLSEP